MSNFSDVPKDKDTRIIRQKEIIIKNIPALKQRWVWDGVLGDSLIFNNEDINHLSDDALQSFINNHSDVEVTGSVTFKRSASGYCFVNFNFVTF